MKSQAMAQRCFSLLLLLLTLSSCQPNPSKSIEGGKAEPETSQSVQPEKAESKAPAEEAKITNVETSREPAQPSDPETTTENEPVGNSPSSPPATADDKTAAADKPAAEQPTTTNKPTTESPAPTETTTASITIDETVCGAGGQEAYFETKVQEIYICKNEAGDLTYIATPKKKGNSLFLPAQKIQQGDLVGYAALDGNKTYIVTPGGFQLQEAGRANQSEKVIRRQLNKN